MSRISATCILVYSLVYSHMIISGDNTNTLEVSTYQYTGENSAVETQNLSDDKLIRALKEKLNTPFDQQNKDITSKELPSIVKEIQKRNLISNINNDTLASLTDAFLKSSSPVRVISAENMHYLHNTLKEARRRNYNITSDVCPPYTQHTFLHKLISSTLGIGKDKYNILRDILHNDIPQSLLKRVNTKGNSVATLVLSRENQSTYLAQLAKDIFELNGNIVYNKSYMSERQKACMAINIDYLIDNIETTHPMHQSLLEVSNDLYTDTDVKRIFSQHKNNKKHPLYHRLAAKKRNFEKQKMTKSIICNAVPQLPNISEACYYNSFSGGKRPHEDQLYTRAEQLWENTPKSKQQKLPSITHMYDKI